MNLHIILKNMEWARNKATTLRNPVIHGLWRFFDSSVRCYVELDAQYGVLIPTMFWGEWVPQKKLERFKECQLKQKGGWPQDHTLSRELRSLLM